jgi:hypothetical protein
MSLTIFLSRSFRFEFPARAHRMLLLPRTQAIYRWCRSNYFGQMTVQASDANTERLFSKGFVGTSWNGTGAGKQSDQPSFHGLPETPRRRHRKPEPRAPRSRSKPACIHSVTRTTSIHCSKRREVREQTRVGTACRPPQTSWHTAQSSPIR